jgi:ectoine hydroxylase
MKWIQQYTGILRRMRLSYILYNLANYKQLKANRALYQKLGIKKSFWQSISHADIHAAEKNSPWLDVKDISENTIRSQTGFDQFDAATQAQILQWPANGFMILHHFLSAAEVDAVNAEVERLRTEQKVDFNFTGRKIMDAWQHSATINQIFRHSKLLQLLQFVLQKEIIPFQTINFERGSEQKPHSDSIHMTTEPLGYLIASWMALEDIDEGSGLLQYYPGSHRLKYLMSEDYESGNNKLFIGSNNYPQYEAKVAAVIAQHQLQPQQFKAKKGDLLVWHANLLHGGTPITNPHATRKSMVAHYFAKGVLCYHEISQRPAIFK